MSENQNKKIRLDEPFGRLGVPPDAPFFGAGYTVINDCVIIVTDKQTAARILGRNSGRGALPS